MKKLKRLIDFRRPRVLRLDCIDLVVENKVIFLLSWEFQHAYKLRLRPGKLKQNASSGAFIASLPSGISTVHITISNYWRFIEFPIHLKHIKLDEQNLSLLSESWNIIRTVTLQCLQPTPGNAGFSIRSISPTFRKISIVPTIKIHFNHSQFNNYVS